MSESQALLWKKGPLRTVWVAAFCRESALSRDHVARTDIIASVDKILSYVQGPHPIPLRIVAQLLFGSVRIYSKKVYYLFCDCEEVRSLLLRQCAPSAPTGGSTRRTLKQANKAVRAGRSVAGQQNTTKVKKTVHAVRTEVSSPVSSEGPSVRVETEVIVRTSVVIREACLPDDLPAFTIPKTFELDSFDLGIAEDTDDEGEDHHQLAHQDILLEDERHHAPYFYESYQRTSYGVDSTCYMPEYIAVPCEVMRAISESNDILDFSMEGDKSERGNQNADSAWFTPVKDVLPPDMMDMVAEAKDRSDKSKTGDNSIREVNMDENVGGSTCSLTPIHLQESQEGQNSENVLENMTSGILSANNPTIEESKNDLLLGKSNTAPPAAGIADHDTGEHESLSAPVLSCETRAENELSPSILNANNPTVEASENDSLLAAGFPEHDTGEHESLEAPVLSCETRAENELSPSKKSPHPTLSPLSHQAERNAMAHGKAFVPVRQLPTQPSTVSRPSNELSPSTPERLPEVVPGPPSSSIFRVRTPAKTEKIQATGKRRSLYNKEDYIPTEREGSRRVRRRLTWCLLDEGIAIPNVLMREAIEDASDLVQKRRKAPHTRLDTWKVAKVGSLPYTFVDPLIPYKTSTPLARVTAPEAPESLCEESVKARRRLSYEQTESVHSCQGTGSTERESIQDASTKRKLDEGTDFEAPVGCHTESGPVQVAVCECNDDTAKEKDTQVEGDEPSSEIPPKKGLHESENQIPLHHEALNAVLDNIDEDIPIYEEPTSNEGLLNSTKTRKIAICLHKLFLDQKSKEGTNTLSLNQVLEGSKRRTSATFFYETLILKSRGLVEVNQGQPYEDIILSATPQLEAEIQRCGN
ncbi:unnamed protein product [Urochloa decumbens]|uniref:Sister chromatid cohesion 1 protein 2 n=1 Tax=Urochloa decumbens TaxID=240449 RepID=A0ABC9F3U4_9POAL